ncbi:MAG: FKBP-type peptidyl-prolyl cis-trans isomerase [Armatimonadetes bacterium]|nr:FKBP-type peptidyl-prolyl cis-trans isomerase [Armatimonadota bacterium]
MTRRLSLTLTTTAALGISCLPGCKTAEQPAAQPAAVGAQPEPGQPKPAGDGKEVQTASGLRYTDQVVGTGKEAKDGMTAVVEYTGTLLNGTQFDTSRGKPPFEFKIGSGQVIKGWDEGVAGMKIGGKRSLKIPAPLGYGAKGQPPTIPPDATLLFDVELKDLK